MKINKSIVLFLVLCGSCISVFSQNKEIPLWDKIPNSLNSIDYIEVKKTTSNGEISGVSKVSQPTLTVFLADSAISNGTAIIICPGGGYGNLAINHEGYAIAKWFNSMGVSAFVLKYRLPSELIMTDKSVGPLQDAQEAIRIVRRNSVKWKIDTNKIGIIGFSAGGHLASTLSTHYSENIYDANDKITARPDFSILIYPVISMQDGITHKGSQNNLLGSNPNVVSVNHFSNEKQVNANTPKTFLIHSSDDKVVPVENSINYYLALIQNKVPVEMHIYENGGHGFGLGREGTSATWPKACEKWLIANGLIPKTE